MSFTTEYGVRIEGITAAQMQAVEAAAHHGSGPALPRMIENAGRNLAMVTIARLKADWQTAPIVVLAGGGHNGCGGICAARHLANRSANVRLLLSASDGTDNLTDRELKIYRAAGGEITEDHTVVADATLILDALSGYRLEQAPDGYAAELIRLTNKSEATVLSLDIPSGIIASSGETPGVYIKADQTMALAWPKSGLAHKDCGELSVADIGLPAAAFAEAEVPFKRLFGARYVIRLYRD